MIFSNQYDLKNPQINSSPTLKQTSETSPKLQTLVFKKETISNKEIIEGFFYEIEEIL